MTGQGRRGFSDNVFVRAVNGLAVAVMNAPILGRLVRRGLVEIRYVGRKSGKTFEIPVGYRRSGESLTIPVGMPEKKNWWRNFLGEGGAITLVGLDGRDRTGHAVATRTDRGSVSVRVRLDD
ncbi:hypothetical protein H7K45_07820 [Mycobacterium yunnanensis]|uniref:DUF385 domain-containing protein n=1 Tax=Mycobacterium yunnanensis TaxID=368477 RepID=A0A9X3C087_9MYCO|nr:hypothetical protein [Mycobacterium yunnanensis]MCV7420443.1 hypothetical protein [Mycobacterium yunnanensis]